MEGSSRADWTLPPAALLIFLVPYGIFLGGEYLLAHFGDPIGYLAQPFARDGHAEGAGRLKVLATFLLLVTFALAVLAYFLLSVRSLERRSRIALLSLYAAVALSGAVWKFFSEPEQTQTYVGQPFVCASLSMLDSPAATAPRAPAGADKPPPAPPRKFLSPNDRSWKPANCEARQFKNLRILIDSQATILIFVLPAVVFGTIACLALPAGASPEERQAALAAQIARLNGLLYLSATLLVCGLLFLSAFASWPAYSLHPADAAPYQAHASSLVLYWGVAYSLFIAGFYVPVAVLLSRRSGTSAAAVLGRPQTGKTSDGDGAATEPLAPLALIKIAAAVFAPAIVGLLGDVFKISG